MLQRMKIGIRLWGGFGLVLLMMTLVAGIGINALNRLDEVINMVIQDRYPKVVMTNKIINNINLIARKARNILLLKDPEKAKPELDGIMAARQAIGEILSNLQNNIHSEKGKALLGAILGSRTAYIAAQDR